MIAYCLLLPVFFGSRVRLAGWIAGYELRSSIYSIDRHFNRCISLNPVRFKPSNKSNRLPVFRKLFTILMLLPGYFTVVGQGEIGIVAGISNYQGDLSSVSLNGGFKALLGPVLGVHLGVEKSNAFQWRADLIYTRISGDDALNANENTRSRNLDFFSPVFQLTAGMDWNFFGFTQTAATDFSPYVSAGIGLFTFSPRTEYEGKTVRLHPLGTEGQYLDDYPEQKPYSLIQPALEFGGGLKFLTSNHLIIALEAMMTYTFTDYLDDASTIYISYPELVAKAGELTAALANRQGELLGTDPVVVPTGTTRANSDSKDLFGVITIRLSKPFAMNKKHFRRNNHNHKRIQCPKF